MTDLSDPPAGWYADLSAHDTLRLWDGARWTDQRRPVSPSGPPSVSPSGPAKSTTRWYPSVGGWAIVAVVLFGVVAVLALVAHASSQAPKAGPIPTAAPPKRPAVSSPSRPAPAQVSTTPAVDCTLPEMRPSSQLVVDWFKEHGLPASGVKPAPSVPAGACSAAGFHDARAKSGVNVVSAYPSPQAASAQAHEIGPSAFAAYIYVVQLDPRLASAAAQYQASLDTYIPILNPAGSGQ